MRYKLTRWNEETGDEKEFNLEVDIGYDEDSYEDGYCAVRGGFYIDGEITLDGKPFEVTDDEREEIKDYLTSNRRKLEGNMRPDPEPYDNDPGDWWT